MDMNNEKVIFAVVKDGDLGQVSVGIRDKEDVYSLCIAIYNLFKRYDAIRVMYPIIKLTLDEHPEVLDEYVTKVPLSQQDFDDILKNLPKQ